ncbi:MAG: hypothetical protein A2020_09710 [Lentisphaerae bacterium GWF2_45_14]|nr:MAG: hypothetical protein A2020_09710 [Lentisphaerae bacterium GWF2_45_14]
MEGIIVSDKEFPAENSIAELATKPCWNFLSSAAHDLRTPLNSIIGFSDMLKGDGDEAHRRMAEHIYDNGHILLNMLSRIIEYSKLETGGLPAIPSECDLKAETECCISEIAKTHPSTHQIELEWNLENSDFITDSYIFKRIVTELLSNAAAFSPESSEIKLSVSGVQDNDGKELIQIDICDRGLGIPPEKTNLIFMPGEKAGMYAEGYKEGLGLGLAYAGKAAELLGGAVKLKPREGGGSIFTLYLPAVKE